MRSIRGRNPFDRRCAHPLNALGSRARAKRRNCRGSGRLPPPSTMRWACVRVTELPITPNGGLRSHGGDPLPGLSVATTRCVCNILTMRGCVSPSRPLSGDLYPHRQILSINIFHDSDTRLTSSRRRGRCSRCRHLAFEPRVLSCLFRQSRHDVSGSSIWAILFTCAPSIRRSIGRGAVLQLSTIFTAFYCLCVLTGKTGLQQLFALTHRCGRAHRFRKRGPLLQRFNHGCCSDGVRDVHRGAVVRLFKYFAVEDSFWGTTFWTFVGEGIFGAVIILIPDITGNS